MEPDVFAICVKCINKFEFTPIWKAE